MLCVRVRVCGCVYSCVCACVGVCMPVLACVCLVCLYVCFALLRVCLFVCVCMYVGWVAFRVWRVALCGCLGWRGGGGVRVHVFSSSPSWEGAGAPFSFSLLDEPHVRSSSPLQILPMAVSGFFLSLLQCWCSLLQVVPLPLVLLVANAFASSVVASPGGSSDYTGSAD